MELQSDTRSKITPAMIAARKEIHGASKNSNGNWGKYASAEDLINCCMTPLLNHGVLLTQGTIPMDGKNWVVTQATHESGEFMRSYTEIVIEKAMDPKKALGGQTYARRGGIESLLCIPRVDDDGENRTIIPPVKEAKKPLDIHEHVTPTEVNNMVDGFIKEVQGYITDQQREEWAVKYFDSGLSADQCKAIFADMGIEDSKSIPVDQLDELLKAMEEAVSGREAGIHGQ
jgi:hypothetical protein